MSINKELAIEDFKNILDLPILGMALYSKMQEYKALIMANIKEFIDIVELRRLVKKDADNWPKEDGELNVNFEIVNIEGIWIPLLPDKQDFEPYRIISDELVHYIVREAAKMDYGIIKRENNLIIPGIKGKVYNIWFEKITDDYIYGIIKPTNFETGSVKNSKTDIDQIVAELKDIDYDKMFEIFRLMFEDEFFRKEVYHLLRIWKTVTEKEEIIL